MVQDFKSKKQVKHLEDIMDQKASLDQDDYNDGIDKFHNKRVYRT